MNTVDFFVSYAGPDRPWAEWAAQQLLRNNFTVELADWDWSAGDNAVLRMDDALRRAGRVLALWSPAYFERNRFTTDEWTAVLAEQPDADGRRLVPVRVAEVVPPPVLRAVVYKDVFGLPEARARRALLEAVAGSSRPAGEVPFPGGPGDLTSGMRVPGSLPQVWNVRRRHPLFTGRDQELAGLRERLCSGDRALVQALHGMGGVGKTELAVEYAHLFGNEYDLVWWIDAERPELIGEQLAALATAAGWAAPAAPMTGEAVLLRLHQEPGWLLIYDNAETVDAIAASIPGGSGHVVITSRSSRTGGVASPVGVAVLDRWASLDRLTKEVPTLPAVDADRLAAAVGDLPLALGQAAGLLAETGMTVDEYLSELTENPADVLAEGPTGRYPRSFTAVVSASMRHLAERDEAACHLMRLIAVLGPETVPLRWFTDAPSGTLPPAVASVAASPMAFRRSLGRLAAFGLARVDPVTLQVHRLTQAVIGAGTGATEIADAERLLAAAAPGDPTDPARWPHWADLLPHLLVRAPGTTSAALRWTATEAVYYLQQRGEYRTARPLAEAWYEEWLKHSGPDDHQVMAAANQLANIRLAMGEYARARQLYEDTLNRQRRVLGDDDPDTLTSANNLAAAFGKLGDHEAARQLDEDTLARRRRVLGDDHADTLTSASNLAADLRILGQYEKARGLSEDTLDRRRRILGDDHPSTLTSADSLAAALRTLGQYEKARLLGEDTLERRRRILGDNHPSTLSSAGSLAFDLSTLGEHEQARRLDEDTLARRRRVLGDDHPDTLLSAHNLAFDLRELGEYEKARQLGEDTLERRRRVLGGDHPETRRTANNLADVRSRLAKRDREARLRW